MNLLPKYAPSPPQKKTNPVLQHLKLLLKHFLSGSASVSDPHVAKVI